MTIRENLDLIDDILDTALSVPLSRGKSIVDIDKIRDALDDIRLNMPSELKQAKMIVEDRKTIIDDARKEADSIVKIAEERAKKLVDTSEIVKQSQERAKEIITQTNAQNRELKRATNEYVETMLKKAEELLANSLQELKATRQAVRAPRSGGAQPSAVAAEQQANTQKKEEEAKEAN